MAKKKSNPAEETAEEVVSEVITEEQADQATSEEAAAPNPEDIMAQLVEGVKQQEEKYLRLLAEYDNFRKRSQKEKEAVWVDVKASTAEAFLPVYDNLERALKQECSDTAYVKGVEMTMSQMKAILEKLGITEIPALHQTFDPTFHNAVMHVDDESLGENTVAEVFQTGFQAGEKVIRFSMVKVAN